MIFGYKNKQNMYFCDIECYKEYCEKHDHNFNQEDISQIKNALTD